AGEGSAAVGAAAGVVALLSDDGEHIEFAGWVGYPIASLSDWQRLRLELATPLTKAVRLGRPVWIDSRREMQERFPEFYPASQAIPTGAWGVVPFVIRASGGHPALGALGLSFTAEGAVPLADRGMAETIAALGASALERVRLFESEQRARIRTERLQRV
ncbi:GAF domain-containing protein, partial [Bradyrhizobium sp. NBAIM08]|uniref:GAF domain-containing protein n=1 Tax=Bradyrhizobium sp. NBAIM08 TaxID=2793815 RepID=UPI001CD7B240